MPRPAPTAVLVTTCLLSVFAIASAQESRPLTPLGGTPSVAAESRAATSKPKRADIYDTKTEGKVLVAAALKKAAKHDKRVLLVFGGNWCGWCHKLHDVFKKEKAIAKILFNEYEVAWIDTNEGNKELIKGYVAKVEGVPYLTVLDASGKVLTNQETGSLEEGDHHDPAKVTAFLEKWQVPAQDAEKVLAAAYARAKAESKLVFLHFGAPWCGWCHRLEEFLAREDINTILSADFVLVKIDEDRMTHGKEVEKGFRTGAGGGIPWTAFLDASGKTLVTSDGPKGNIGCPWEPHEIDWFMEMLKKVRNRITPDQLGSLETALRKYAEPKKAESRP